MVVIRILHNGRIAKKVNDKLRESLFGPRDVLVMFLDRPVLNLVVPRKEMRNRVSNGSHQARNLLGRGF